jgi:hypothetical protein
MPETNLETVLDYLRRHGREIDPDALREHLLAQGYDPVLIDQAMDAYREEGFQTAQKELSGTRVFLGCFGGLVAGLLSLASLLLGVCANIFGEGKNVVSPFLYLVGIGLAVIAFYALRPIVAKWKSG